MFRRLAAALLALGLILSLAAPAMAVELFQDTPISWDDPEFQGSLETCAADEETHDLQPGDVLWHFLHNQTTATGGTLSAEFDVAGPVSKENGAPFESNNLHYWVITGQDTLESASDDVADGKLVLSHICSVPDEEIPEAPAAMLLALIALAAVGGYLAIDRRRANQAA